MFGARFLRLKRDIELAWMLTTGGRGDVVGTKNFPKKQLMFWLVVNKNFAPSGSKVRREFKNFRGKAFQRDIVEMDFPTQLWDSQSLRWITILWPLV